MADVRAQGGAPVSFVDGDGRQHAIPLNYVTFSTITGTLSAKGWPEYMSLQSTVDAWLPDLAGQGLLTASKAPANPPAFTIAARDPGITGNDITVVFTNVTPNAVAPSQSKADVKVSASQVYGGLTLAGITAILGTSPGTGASPGLVKVGNVSADLPTATAAPENFTGSPAKLDVASATGRAFELLATHSAAGEEADAALLQASISSVNSGAGTFTLTLDWSKSATGVELGSLASVFGYVLTVTPPPGGFVYPPAAGTLRLLGGTDPVTSTITAPPTPAQAVVVAG